MKKRLTSMMLILAMILSLVPTNAVFAETTELTKSNYKVYIDKTQHDIEASEGAVAMEVVPGQGQTHYFWHYSGGYWKIGGKKVYDNEFAESLQTAGGTADLQQIYTIPEQPFVFNLAKGTSGADALDKGEEVIFNLKSLNEADLPMSALFSNIESEHGFSKNMKVKSIEKLSNGDYEVILMLSPKMRFYDDRQLSYNDTYKLNLKNYIPFVYEGYGSNLYAMWTSSDKGAGRGWVNPDKPYDLTGMPEGAIHPTMIRPFNALDAYGKHTGTTNNGGLLYDRVPVYEKVGPKIQVAKDANGAFITAKRDGKDLEVYYPKHKGMKALTYANIGKNTFANAGSMGVEFYYPVQLQVYTKAPITVVETYVKIAGVTEDGEVVYEEFAPTTERAGEIDERTGYLVLDGATKRLDGGIGMLNDIITSPKDMTGDIEELAWLGVTPKTAKEQIELSGEDIAYYKLGMVSANKAVIDKLDQVAQDAKNPKQSIDSEGKYSFLEVPNAAGDAQYSIQGDEEEGNESTRTWNDFTTYLGSLFKVEESNGQADSTKAQDDYLDYTQARTSKATGLASGIQSDIASDVDADRYVIRALKELEKEEVELEDIQGKDLEDDLEVTIISKDGTEQKTSVSEAQQQLDDLKRTDSTVSFSVQTVDLEGREVQKEEDAAAYIIYVQRIPTALEGIHSIPVYMMYDQVMTIIVPNQSYRRAAPTTVNHGSELGSIDGVEGTIEIKNHASALGTTDTGKTAVNTVYLRYIVIEHSTQVNIIDYKRDGVSTGVSTITTVETPMRKITANGTVTPINDIRTSNPIDYGNASLVNWYTADGLETDRALIPGPNGNLSGTTLGNITDLPTDENIYVFWEINEISPGAVGSSIPEWRLSQYEPFLSDQVAYMGLGSYTNGHCGYDWFYTSGRYVYKTINPNGLDTAPLHDPLNKSMDRVGVPWYHSTVVTSVTNSNLSKSQLNARVSMTTDLNVVKADALSGLKLAAWKVDASTAQDLRNHNFVVTNMGSAYSGLPVERRAETLTYQIENTRDYSNRWYIRSGTRRDSDGNAIGHYHSSRSKTFSPSYSNPSVDVTYDFERYIVQNTDARLFTSSPELIENNGKTTLSVQQPIVLNVYPEVPMLFDNDNPGIAPSIQFAIGDLARKIQPVTYHSLEYKVFVDPKVQGMSNATASQAKMTANSIGLNNKAVIHKGSAVTLNYNVTAAQGNNNRGHLEVKTYALDVSNADGLKTAWGNASYSAQALHDNFVGSWSFQGQAKSRLEVLVPNGSNTAYQGAFKQNNVSFTNRQNSPTRTYAITVRGGSVSHVDGIAISSIKRENKALYEALEGMRLVGANKDQTVLATFEHQQGKLLTEQSFIDEAQVARDGVNNLALNSGWYSEDSTVLLVREYTTTYDVPNAMFSDVLPMSISGGLQTPINKNMFYRTMSIGHTFLNFDMRSNNIPGVGTVKAFLEVESRTNSTWNNVTRDYGVPNVSIVDTTGFN